MLTIQVCVVCRKAYGCTSEHKVMSCYTENCDNACESVVWDLQYCICPECNGAENEKTGHSLPKV